MQHVVSKGKEFSFSVHNVPEPKDAGKVSLQHVKLECDHELRMLLKGLEYLVQERLSQSFNLQTFVLELKDVLERIVRTQSKISLPQPKFYDRLCSDLDFLGWEHLAWLSNDLTSLHLRHFDKAGREHILQICLPAAYPEAGPTASAALPMVLALQWQQGSTLKDSFSQYVSVVERYQDFWEVMEDIDRRVWVMEPEHPSRSDMFRRIALGGHCSLSITVDPVSPRSFPECRFFGSDVAISPLRKKLNKGIRHWKPERLLIENLENALELTFPSPQDARKEDMSADCGICYAYRVSEGNDIGGKGGTNGSVPDRVCDNVNCERPFHSVCLTEWLRSITTTRQSFDVLFGQCPYCSHPIAVKGGSSS